MKIAFVIPWYGDIPGGAESECKNTAEKLSQNGINVEILTTCAKEFLSDWNHNYYSEGIYQEGGLIVRRFSLSKRKKSIFDQINFKLLNNLPVTKDEEKVFVQEMINSDKLYQFIQDNGDNYDFFIFIPYMFGTTFHGSLIHPHKSILIPCLHDERYAYMDIYKPMFRSVNTILFNTETERNLFNRIIMSNSRQYVMGIGIDTHIKGKSEDFRMKFGITDSYILYAGRRDSGKMVDELINYFIQYLEKINYPLKLLLIGKGSLNIPKKYSKRIIDLGFINSQDKYNAFAAASVFCMPSLNESFSLVMMEAWLCGTPNLVNGKCEVTKTHCIHSNGGLYYDNYEEFEECLTYLIKNSDVQKKLANNGRNYVFENYDWRVIISKYLTLFREI